MIVYKEKKAIMEYDREIVEEYAKVNKNELKMNTK